MRNYFSMTCLDTHLYQVTFLFCLASQFPNVLQSSLRNSVALPASRKTREFLKSVYQDYHDLCSFIKYVTERNCIWPTKDIHSFYSLIHGHMLSIIFFKRTYKHTQKRLHSKQYNSIRCNNKPVMNRILFYIPLHVLQTILLISLYYL